MRSKQAIKSEMTTAFMANETFAAKYGFEISSSFEQYFSIVSIENIWFEIISICMFIQEQLFNQHTNEINEKLANQKSGTLSWYRTMALRFQFGFNLVQDEDHFDNSQSTVQQVELSKVIKYAAVNESEESSRLIIKIAGEAGGKLAPISSQQKESFEAYIKEIKFAGVQTTVINYLPDRLFLSLQIKRDPLVLAENGMSLQNGNFPVNDALDDLMKELPFNGELKLSALVDKLQVIPGVIDATILNAQSSWINPETSGYGIEQPIFISAIPASGYFEIVTFDNIAYVV